MHDFSIFIKHTLHSFKVIRGVVFSLILILFLCAVGLSTFDDMPFGDAVYLTAITALTVGYGDLAPSSAMGRLISAVVGLIGIVITGLVVSIAVHAMTKTMEHKKRREQIGPDDADSAG